MIDFEYLYKDSWDATQVWRIDKWDVFLSAFNSSDRLKIVFDRAKAALKCWFVSPEYKYVKEELPANDLTFMGDSDDEAASIVSFIGSLNTDLRDCRFCIDTTGFMRHHLLVLIRHLASLGVTKFDALYCEPLQYAKKENTLFSDGEVREVRQVPGYEGNHDPDTSNDLLIIAAGYDHKLIAHAAEFKSNAKKIQVLGLPSLRPDMYQENVLRAHRAAEQLGSRSDVLSTVFAPANDPFVTAATLRNIVKEYNRNHVLTNLYLCPLSTKAITLGFGLYYLGDWINRNASLILPYTKGYSRETSIGVGRVWLYGVEIHY
jgi:hypothetical protein